MTRSSGSPLSYRPDIDGLRAFAVLPVVLYHAGVPAFSGGYVGVDVFFVISGYLITRIIVSEIEQERFSISRFYERRFRRILPALAVMVMVTLLAGFMLLTPSQLVDLGQSVVATGLFSSNVLFYLETGYFDAPAELKPLLHTWSLAVEEQYYVFFPLLLTFVGRFLNRRFAPVILAIGALSLIACVGVSYLLSSSFAFYLIPTRAWELFVGSALALHQLPDVKSVRAREALAATGVCAILISVFCFDEQTVFPGIAAVLPTLGTALIIHAGCSGHSGVYRALSLKPVVFVGLISYSLYLWHWPIIAYTKLYLILEPTWPQRLTMLALMFPIAWLSWRFIESPLRARTRLRTPNRVFAAAAAATLSVIVAGTVLIWQQGFPARQAGLIASTSAGDDGEWQRWSSCEDVVSRLADGRDLCLLDEHGGAATVMLWGDSHARSLASAVKRSAVQAGSNGVLATQTACPPLLGIERPGRRSCDEFSRTVLEYLAAHPEIHTVVLAARWALSATGERYRREPGNPVDLIDLLAGTPESEPNAMLFARGLQRTVTAISRLDRRIVLVGPIPEVGIDVPSAVFAAGLTHRDVNLAVGPSRAEFAARNEQVWQSMDSLPAAPSLLRIEPEKLLCDDSRCMVALDGVPLYRDDDHLSLAGARRVTPLFDSIW